ncbi:MAG: hypothetical protein M0Q15_01000 [Nevskia sp.]|nr:hypothetical protein [Nevskia sp.]
MNHKINSRRLRLLGLVLSFVLSASAFAQSVDGPYKTEMAMAHDDVPGKVGADLGEQFSMYTGALEFRQTDLSLPGTGPSIAVSRRLVLGNQQTFGSGSTLPLNRFDDWQLEVPRIWVTIPPTDGAPALQDVGGGYPSRPHYDNWQTNSCSAGLPEVFNIFTSPVENSASVSALGLSSGYHLAMPGATDELILNREGYTPIPANSHDPAPNASGNSPYLTKSNWRISCGTNLKNAQGQVIGESFVGTAPDGTTYYFDRLTGENDFADPAIVNDYGSSIPITRFSVVATKVVDVYGNAVNYNYDASGRLASITASDGRYVQFAYGSTNPNYITSVTAGGTLSPPRTWTYSYENHIHYANAPRTVLRTVTRPDGSTWRYNMDDAALPPGGRTSSCIVGVSALGSITTPFGLTAQYSFRGLTNGRISVENGHEGYWAGIGSCGGDIDFSSFALQSKTYSGSGMPTSTWNFSYTQPSNYYGVTHGLAPAAKVLTITNPDGSTTKITADAHRNYSEGQILSEATASPSGTLVRRTDSTYALGHYYGFSPSGGDGIFTPPSYYYRNPSYAAYFKANLTRRDITQDGTTYTTTWSQFDGFDMPGQMVESNSAGGPAKTTTLTYYTDLNKWIIDKPLAMSVNGTEAMRMAYGAKGEITSVTAFGLPKAYMSYDALGQLATMSDPLGDVTTYSNYYRGTARTVRLPDATQMTMAVNDFGELTSMSNALGATWTMGRDGLGRITSMYFPSADTVAWAPEAMTYVQLTASELGIPVGSWRGRKIVGRHQQTMYFDAELRPVLVEDRDTTTGVARYQRMRYDYADRMTFTSYSSTDPNISSGTTISYDSLGRMVRMQATDGTVLESIAYLSGNRVQVTDASGNITTTTYQAFGAPDNKAATTIAAPEGQTTQINRDVFGKVTSATQGGLTQTWVYDSYQRLCKKIEPEGGATLNGFDAAGRMLWQARGQASTAACSSTAPAGAVTMNYDALSRPTLLHYPDATGDVRYTYDAVGNRLSVSNPTATWTYTYNKRNLLETQTANIAGDTRTFALLDSYDSLGNVISHQYPDALRVDYAPNAFGEPTQMLGYCCNNALTAVRVSGIQYHPNGTIANYSTGSGLTFSQTLNARQRPETLQLKNGASATLQSLTYGYSAAGDVTWILDGVDGADTVNNLTYDGLHRLKTANGIWGSYSYTYDGLNNLISRTGTNPLSYGYDTATNRLSSVAGLAAPPAAPAPPPAPAPAPSPAPSPNPKPIDPCSGFACTPPATTASFSNLSGATAVTQTVTTATRTYSYNSRGAMVSDGIRSFTLNANDQITSAAGATYAYDGNGKRIKTTKADGTTEYTLYDASGTLATHFLRSGAGVTTNYLQLGGKTIVEAANGVPTYLHADLLGSPRLATNTSGSTVWREHYGPYGEKLNGVNDKIGYTGHAYDAESQLTYAQARFYDPAIGRFMSIDPIGFTGSPFTFNRYSYGNNNPFAYIDPTGMYSCSGSEFECGTIDDFVSTISMALTTLDPKSDAFQKVSTVVNYLGTAGDKNGVTIKASSLPSRVLASADKNNTINVDVSQVSKFSSNYSKANPTMSPSDLKSATGAGAVAHEARHEVDYTKSGYPNTKQAEYRTELNAYRTQADVFQGLGFHTGLGYPGMTESEQDKAISNAAQVSTDARCAQGGPC